MRVPAVLSLVALLSACDALNLFESRADPPVVRTELASVPPGGTMPLLLISKSQQSWTYGACSHQVDRLEAGTWVMVDNSLARPCVLVGHSLRAGDTASVPIGLPAVDGTYRIRFRFLHFPDNRAAEVWVTSNRFIVGVATFAR